jgi:hypothetical protein
LILSSLGLAPAPSEYRNRWKRATLRMRVLILSFRFFDRGGPTMKIKSKRDAKQAERYLKQERQRQNRKAAEARFVKIQQYYGKR